MDRRLLRYYDLELQHLRNMGVEFAREFPRIAGRLGMEGLTCADPFVERLMEGVAFLTARVHLKLDAEFPRFTRNFGAHVFGVSAGNGGDRSAPWQAPPRPQP